MWVWGNYMESNNLSVSIIVPVFNGEAYIQKCINSLIKQTYENIEIIIINDGSEDKTESICSIFEQKYENIKLLNKVNEGVTVARLCGIKQAKGKYISFVDADDWIENDYVEKMMNYLSDADIVVGGIKRILVDECFRLVEERNSISAGMYEKTKGIEALYEKMLCFSMPFKMGILPYACNKIYKRDILLPLMEQVDKQINDGEDVAIIFPYIINSNKIVVTDYCGYNYLIHKDSASNSKKQDAYYNASRLYAWLYKCFYNNEYSDILLPQLRNYFLRMVWKRDPSAYLLANDFVFPFEYIDKGNRIILYGAGDVGQAYYFQIMQTNYCDIVAWADKNLKYIEEINYTLIKPEEIISYEFDKVVIAISSIYVCEEIKNYLIDMNIAEQRIVFAHMEEH